MEGEEHHRAYFPSANIVSGTKEKHCLIIQEEWDAVLTVLHIHLVTVETLRGVGDSARGWSGWESRKTQSHIDIKKNSTQAALQDFRQPSGKWSRHRVGLLSDPRTRLHQVALCANNKIDLIQFTELLLGRKTKRVSCDTSTADV